MSKWYFPQKEQPSRELKFDGHLGNFHGYGIDGLIRENIQNSLDHPINSGATVQIKIDSGQMPISQFPDFDIVRDHIMSLVAANHYERDRITRMKQAINSIKSQVPYFLYEDKNTTGLNGVGDNTIEKSKSFYSYAYLKGSHVEHESEEQEGLRGGSHGIGKIASNAASEIHTMFFANHDEHGNRHTGGSILLIDHELQGQRYAADGFLSKYENADYLPFSSDLFPPLFSKEQRGLRIIIPFIKDQLQDPEKIKQAVVDSFLLAIKRNQLLAEIKDSILSYENLDDYLSDFSSEDDFNKDASLTKEYYKTLDHLFQEDFVVQDKRGKKYYFDLYLRRDDSIRKAKVAIFRRIGMKISDLTVSGTSSFPINGVLVSKNKETDKFLVSMENESHTKLDPAKVISDNEDRINAENFLRKLNKDLGTIMKNLLEADFKSEDKFNTGDVLYDFDNKFKDQLQKKVKPILGDGSLGTPHVVQTTEGEKERGQTKERKGKGYKVGPLKPTKIPGLDSDKTFYRLPNYSIRRYSTNQMDVIDLNIDGTHYNDSDTINVVLSLIDGDGSEKLIETDLREMSNEIIDQNTNQPLVFSKYQIKGLSIIKSRATIMIKHINDQIDFNKYVIYVEE
jgi:hypothetical protein